MLFLWLSAGYLNVSADRRRPVSWSARVGQRAGFLAPLARVLVGDLGVKLGQPDVEGALQACGFLPAFGRGQIPQVREVILQLVHQAITFQKIFVAIHRATPKANSKDQNYRLTFRCRTTESECRTTECEPFAELHRFPRPLRFCKAVTSQRFVTAFSAA